MNLRALHYFLLGLAIAVSCVGLLALGRGANRRSALAATGERRLGGASRAAARNANKLSTRPTSQVVVGTPEFYAKVVKPRYSYRNELPKDQTKLRTLYLIDKENGQETRIGDDSQAVIFGAMNEQYLLWFSIGEGIHLYTFATGKDRFIYPATSTLEPQIAGDWIAFGRRNQVGYDLSHTLYAANLQTNEIITLTQSLNTPGGSGIDLAFGISKQMAAWLDPPDTIVVYDLTSHRELTQLTDLFHAFDDQANRPILEITPGESVVTWSRHYGYDLVTHSYFRIDNHTPPDWGDALVWNMSRIYEEKRVLAWSFDMQDGTQRYIHAPLLDATPSTAPCVEGQNLVQNGDLEDIAAHNAWQQSDSPSDLIVNDLPPNSPQAGQWAIRLGRYSNSQPTIQQTLHIPSGVKHITLAFDVRASSWDIWGGDQLQVDLIDPVTHQSVLATPVQWTNRQLANGGWIPLQVDIQDWPGIDTPLYLIFRATTDWAFPTTFTLDNIRFTTACQ